MTTIFKLVWRLSRYLGRTDVITVVYFRLVGFQGHVSLKTVSYNFPKELRYNYTYFLNRKASIAGVCRVTSAH